MIVVSTAHRLANPGRDPGAPCVNGRYEAEWSLLASTRLVALLNAAGVQAMLYNKPAPTKSPKRSSLSWGIQEIRKHKPKLALEMHMDSCVMSPGQAAPDRATILHNGRPAASRIAKALSVTLPAARVAAEFSPKCILAGPLEYKAALGRGRLGWIEDTEYPAILTESGFGVHSGFIQWAFTDAGATALAEAHAKAILSELCNAQ